ncbi:hypothetical protein M758_12G163500 [Ceratodon purpureus]|nr:hypothetical protein M758_12G163500 [Ceratodon purpureus]
MYIYVLWLPLLSMTVCSYWSGLQGRPSCAGLHWLLPGKHVHFNEWLLSPQLC